MRLRANRGGIVTGELLAAERLWNLWRRLIRSRPFTRHGRDGRTAHAKGKERLTGKTIEQKRITLFRHLCHRVDSSAIVLDCDQIRRRRHVEVPKVVKDALKGPE